MHEKPDSQSAADYHAKLSPRYMSGMVKHSQTNAISIGLVASRKFLNYKSELLAPAGTFYQAVRA